MNWISVDDRLPEFVVDGYENPVLVLIYSDKCRVACFNAVENYWVREPDEYVFVPGAVTHWMPLPNLPEEKK